MPTAEEEISIRDLKLIAITKFANQNWNIPHLQNPALRPVSDSLRANIARIRLLMLLPSTISGHVSRAQKWTDVAELEVTGSVGGSEITPEINAKVEKRFYEHWDKLRTELEGRRGSPEWDPHVASYHEEAIAILLPLARQHHGALSFTHLLATYLTGTWTAIETMLGDPWEASVNAHPERLASLAGKPTRIAKLGANEGRNESELRRSPESKVVPLDLIAMQRYDVRHKMGTILRARFEFSRLSSIREAYSSAFDSKAGRIDAALASKSLDALSAIRNAILHRAGYADAEYERRAKYLPLPSARGGQPIQLGGDNVVALIEPSIKSACNVMTAVSDWLE